jgi:SAM-dependent methyltransferase
VRRGPRDTRTFYRDTEPMDQVDDAVVDFVAETRGPGRPRPRLRDRRVLARARGRGFTMTALDVVPEYVGARALDRRGRGSYDGERVPLEDGSVDTVILLEVLEHLEDPAALLREARRVAARTCS